MSKETVSTKAMTEFHTNAMELMPNVEYHNSEHAEQIAQVAKLLGVKEGMSSQYDRQVLTVAGWFHDTGHSNGSAEGHEERSCELLIEFCEELRRNMSVPQPFIDDVCDAIMGTVFLEEASTTYGRVLSDADVWSFGSPWPVFFKYAKNVHQEFAPEVSIDEWMGFRGTVINNHSYATQTAREAWGEQKQRNFKRIKEEYGLAKEPPWGN